MSGAALGTAGASEAAAGAATEISARLRLLADAMDAAAAALPGGAPGWTGPAADAASRLLATRPERFRAAGLACRSAADALSRHAEALGPAIALDRRAQLVPAEPAVLLEQRAQGQAGDSARQTAGVLLALAGSAPRRGDGWHRLVRQVDTWRGEVLLGAAESTEELAGTVLGLALRLANPFRSRAPDVIRDAGLAAADAVRHPVEFGKAVLDWDTWRQNPFRAVGHLAPDVASAVAGGAAATSARATTVARRSRAAAQAAAARDGVRRTEAAAAAASARRALVRQAQAAAEARLAAGLWDRASTWRGAGGTWLTPLQNADAEAFHALVAAREPPVTAALHQVTAVSRGRLVGLDHRLKQPDSYKRKLATAYASTGEPLPRLLANAQDAVRYSVVIDDAHYVRGVADIAAALERRGFHAGPPHNAWFGPRYRGLNSTWLDPTTGTAFEVQFHTPASWRVTRQTHGLYEEFRLPDVSPERKAELHELIAAEYRKVPIPGWVQLLKDGTFPPATRPDPITPPVDYTVHAAIIGAGGSHLAVAGARGGER
jgi:hypothetical protein